MDNLRGLVGKVVGRSGGAWGLGRRSGAWIALLTVIGCSAARRAANEGTAGIVSLPEDRVPNAPNTIAIEPNRWVWLSANTKEEAIFNLPEGVAARCIDDNQVDTTALHCECTVKGDKDHTSDCRPDDRSAKMESNSHQTYVCKSTATIRLIGLYATKGNGEAGDVCLGGAKETKDMYILHFVPALTDPSTGASAAPKPSIPTVFWIDPATGRPSEGVRVCVGPDGAAVAFKGTTTEDCTVMSDVVCKLNNKNHLAFIKLKSTDASTSTEVGSPTPFWEDSWLALSAWKHQFFTVDAKPAAAPAPSASAKPDAGSPATAPTARFGTTTLCLGDCSEPGHVLTVDWTTDSSGKCR